MERQPETLLVGDIGGTNSRFALAERREDNVSIRHFWKTPGADHASFDAALRDYLSHLSKRPQRAVFGVAGPVINNKAELTNIGWLVDGGKIASEHGFSDVVVINDFVAMARSATALQPNDDVVPLAPGAGIAGAPIVVGGPGTGFGLASVHPFGGDWLVIGGQGGHQAFAPRDDLETELLARLSHILGYVSNENVVAGVGFETTLNTLHDIFGMPRRKLSPTETLSLAQQEDPVCTALCQLRANVTMSAVGDAVLATVARGGAFVAGGVSVALRNFLQTPVAVARFRERGPMTDFMADIPISLITSSDAPLIGAACYRKLP